MDFDISWKEPTEMQLEAWKHACNAMGIPKKDREWAEKGNRHHMLVMHNAIGRSLAVDAEIYSGPAHKMTPYDLAEMMLTAHGSLWFTQAKGWAGGNTPPYCADEKTTRVFQIAGQAIVKIVDWGYRDGRWWNLEAIWPDPKTRALTVAAIIDACRMARLIAQNTMAIQSGGFAYLPLLIVPKLNIKQAERNLAQGDKGVVALMAELLALFDPEFRKEASAVRREAKRQIHETYEPTKCIKPECNMLVAPKGIKPREGHAKNYRGKGACCRGHANYWCTKCKAPHSYTSKIGQNHLQFFGKDWDGVWDQ